MLPGHFPGHPIVPGAWLLAWIVQAVERKLKQTNDERVVVGIRRVKFLRPLAPNKRFELELTRATAPSDAWRFALTSDGAVIADGSLRLQRAD